MLTCRCDNADSLLAALDERISQVRAESYAYSEAETSYKALREAEYGALLSSNNDKKGGRNTRGAGGGGGGADGSGGGRNQGGLRDLQDVSGDAFSGAGGGPRRSGRRAAPGSAHGPMLGQGQGQAGGSGIGEADNGDASGLLGRLWVRFLSFYHGSRLA